MAREKKDLGTQRQHQRALAGMPEINSPAKAPEPAAPQPAATPKPAAASVKKPDAKPVKAANADAKEKMAGKRYSHRVYLNISEELQAALTDRSETVKKLAGLDVSEAKILTEIIARHDADILKWVQDD